LRFNGGGMKDFFEKLTQRLKGSEYLVIIAGAAVAGLVTYNFVFTSAGSRMSEVKRKIKVSETRLQRLRELETGKSVILQEYARIKPYTFNSPSEQELMTRILKEVEKITQESAVSVVSLQPSREFTRDRGGRRYRLDIQVEGDMKQILAFLDKIQGSGFLLVMDSLVLSPKQDESRLLHLDSTISFFYYATIQ
jgi:hypothetical protein